MTRKIHEENERIKRRYLTFLREAKRADHATVDKAADAIRELMDRKAMGKVVVTM